MSVRKKITLKKGTLPGYKLDIPEKTRRTALKKAVDINGYVTVMRKVNVLSIFLRKSSPAKSKKAESDKNWLKKTFGSNSPKRKSNSRRRKSKKPKRKSRKPKRKPKRKSRKSKRKSRKSRKHKRKSRKSKRK